MLYISLIASTILFTVSLFAVWLLPNPRRTYLLLWLGVFGSYLVMCVLPTYLLHAVLNATAGTICRWRGAGPKAFTYWSAAAFVVSYLAVGVPRALELRQLMKEYPFESLDERLAYERRGAGPSNGGGADGIPDDAPEFGVAWNMNRSGSRFRAETLEDLHTGCVHMFVNAPGFGIARIIRYLPYHIQRADSLRDAQPVGQPEESGTGRRPLSASDLALGPPTESDPQVSGVDRDSLQFVHRDSAGEFLNPLAFGYVRDRGHVAGFVSHRFTTYPYKPAKPEGDGQWRFESLDLISLLKHPQPVAYVSKHLPRMDELRDVPCRPLDEFETENLPKLRAGDELASAQGPRRLRMIGAIRARDECLKCHSAEPGELLGAFSYDLRRDRP